MVVNQVNWEHEVLTDPEAVREWLTEQAKRGIEHLRQEGVLIFLRGGPTATSYLQLHVASGCVFHMLTSFRGMLVAVNLATEATRELANELEIQGGNLEAWIPTQEWRCLLSVEVPLAYLGLPKRYMRADDDMDVPDDSACDEDDE